jgi:hypothetical protein
MLFSPNLLPVTQFRSQRYAKYANLPMCATTARLRVLAGACLAAVAKLRE